MGRLRVFSFISAGRRGSKTNPPSPPTPLSDSDSPGNHEFHAPLQEVPHPTRREGPATLKKSDRTSRVVSLLQQPPLASLGAANSPVPELEPIFSYLNNQSGKLYYEGYFFKLNDLDNYGRPCQDRQWTEYFAQLVGTVLSLWDPVALDAAGPNGDVMPAFINLADASIKMIENLPTRSQESQPLQNVLSLSTAGKNRYLLHFNSLSALTQWTAAIRLTMYENTLLQESYTGALIAGKGKSLNGIREILEKTTFKHEDWVRVRFGPGTPWRRCWCVVSQADEKEVQKHKKMHKKKSAYERPAAAPKGNIKFYTSKKTKKTIPVATISDAYSAFAIYPQSRSLVEQSTLVKVEGRITIHAKPEQVADGFVFVLPELHAAVSGFETMVRWLFPVFDAFHLYGRPTRLLADTVSTRSLMFAMPRNRRSMYLDTLDVAALIHTEGSRNWSEREWRQQLKEATARRINSGNTSRVSSISGRRGPNRGSLPAQAGSLRFDATGGPSSSRRLLNNHSTDALSLPSQRHHQTPGPPAVSNFHARTVSDMTTLHHGPYSQEAQPYQYDSRLLEDPTEDPPQPPPHTSSQTNGAADGYVSGERSSSDSENKVRAQRQDIVEGLKPSPLPSDLAVPPAFSHNPNDKPHIQPKMSPELKRAGSRISQGTFKQMADANGISTHGKAEGLALISSNEGRQNPVFPPPSRDAGYGDVSPEQTMFDGNTQFSKQTAADASSSHYSSPTSPVNPAHDGLLFPSSINPVNANSSIDAARQFPQQPLQLDTLQTIHRKPLAQTQDGSHSPTKTISSIGSLRHAIDVDALNMVMTRERTPSPPPPPRTRYMVEPEVAHEPSSATTPDYASSYKSTASNRSEKSVTKPRMGKMRVVGTPEPALDDLVIGDTRYKAGSVPEPNPDIPLVDFGPTMTYSPGTRRPSTGDTLTLLSKSKNASDPALVKNDKRSTWFGMESKPARPGNDERRRSFLWQPGMVESGRQSPGPGLTPEQFVEQRASSGSRGASPVYAHQRSSSRMSNQSRPASGDWTNQLRQQSMYQMPPRPSSRGSGIMLNQTDVSPHLSAREQEHVARMTGSSFFNMDKESSKRSSVGGFGSGLVSAIDARERERQAMKEGVSGQMVQQAIMQRQYQGQPQPLPQSQVLQSSASQYNLPMNQYPATNAATSVYNFPARNTNSPSRYHRFSKSQDHLQYMK